MNLPFEIRGVKYDFLKEEDLGRCVEVISKYFGPFEPINRAVGIQPIDFEGLARYIGWRALQEGLSMAATDALTGEFIAPVILKRFTQKLPESVSFTTPKLSPVFSVLESLNEMYNSTTPPENTDDDDDTLELYIGLTPPEYQNMGISSTLWAATELVAQQFGYKKIVSTVTGGASAHIAINKLGFSVLHEIQYKSFQYSGENVFASIKETETCKFVTKQV